MPQVGPLELLLIVFVAAMVFGPNELPKAARGAARMWRQAQGFRAEVTRHVDEALREDDRPSGEAVSAHGATTEDQGGHPSAADRLG